MRYRFSEIAPSNKRQYVFAVGVKDIEILLGLTTKSCSVMPKLDKQTNLEYDDIYTRLRSMNKAFRLAYQEAGEISDEGKRTHNG